MIFPTYPSPCLTSDPLVRLAKTAADDHHAGLRCYLFIRMRFLVISHFGVNVCYLNYTRRSVFDDLCSSHLVRTSSCKILSTFSCSICDAD